MTYQEYTKLHEILNTDFKKSDVLEILDMAMQSDDLEQTLEDFCKENDIELGEEDGFKGTRKNGRVV